MILADREKVRFFTIYLGHFEGEVEEIDIEDVPQKVKSEGYRPGKVQRHIADHLKHHLKNVGKEAWQYVVKKRIKQLDGVFLGTHKSLFGDLKNNLPAKLKHKVLGEFVMEPNNAVGDIANTIISKFNL